MGWLADAMGDSEPPWWAAFAEEVNPFLESEDAAGLCAALGLGDRDDGDWLLVWRYPVKNAGPLYRPTVAEAYVSPFHFPSFPDHPWGITMPLDPVMAGCREVLHPPLRGAAAIAGSIGKLLRLNDFQSRYAPRNRLPSSRSSQRQRLLEESPESAAWVTRHQGLE